MQKMTVFRQGVTVSRKEVTVSSPLIDWLYLRPSTFSVLQENDITSQATKLWIPMYPSFSWIAFVHGVSRPKVVSVLWVQLLDVGRLTNISSQCQLMLSEPASIIARLSLYRSWLRDGSGKLQHNTLIVDFSEMMTWRAVSWQSHRHPKSNIFQPLHNRIFNAASSTTMDIAIGSAYCCWNVD